MLKLTMEAIKKLPQAAALEYFFKLGKERQKNPNESKFKSAIL